MLRPADLEGLCRKISHLERVRAAESARGRAEALTRHAELIEAYGLPPDARASLHQSLEAAHRAEREATALAMTDIDARLFELRRQASNLAEFPANPCPGDQKK